MFARPWTLRLLLPLLLAAGAGSGWAAPALDTAAKARIDALPAYDVNGRLALIQPLLATSTAPDDRVWLLDRLAGTLGRERHWDAAMQAAQDGLALAKNPADKAMLGTRLMRLLLDQKQAQTALQVYERVLPLLPSLAGSQWPADQQRAADVRQAGGVALAQLGRLPEAMQALTTALRSSDLLHDATRQAETLAEVALVHFLSGRPDEALETVQRAIDIAEAAHDDGSLSMFYLRRSHYQAALGQTAAQQQSLLIAQRRARVQKNDYNLAVAATNLADVALQYHDYPRVLAYVDEAIPLVEATHDGLSLAVNWINRGIAMNRLHQPGGIALIERAYEAIQKLPGQHMDAILVQDTLAEEYAFNGDFERAYRAAQRFKELDAKHRKATDLQRVADADAAYKVDLKQRQIDELRRDHQAAERYRMLWVLIGVLGLGIAAVVVRSRHSLRKAYQAMEDIALKDPLTGLKNRRYLTQHIDDDLAQLRRRQHDATRAGAGAGVAAAQCDMAFLMIDMDHFKSVNDAHGHAAGDAVLVQVADILRAATRESDSVARWGGEEFLVVAKSTDMHEAHLLAERLRAQVQAHAFDIGGGQVLHKTCSIGFACYPPMAQGQPWAHWENVVSLADQCLYRVKENGRNGWLGVMPQGDASQLSWDLDQALRQGEVRLVQAPPGEPTSPAALHPA